MPLNGGEMEKMAGQEGSRPRAAQLFQLAKKSRIHFSSQSKNLCKKNNHGSYLLRFSTMPQFETVLLRKTNQGRCRVQVLHTVGWMCVKQKSWLWCSDCDSVASTSAKTTLWCYWKFKKFSLLLLYKAVSTTARLKCLHQTQNFHNDQAP